MTSENESNLVEISKWSQTQTLFISRYFMIYFLVLKHVPNTINNNVEETSGFKITAYLPIAKLNMNFNTENRHFGKTREFSYMVEDNVN